MLFRSEVFKAGIVTTEEKVVKESFIKGRDRIMSARKWPSFITFEDYLLQKAKNYPLWQVGSNFVKFPHVRPLYMSGPEDALEDTARSIPEMRDTAQLLCDKHEIDLIVILKGKPYYLYKHNDGPWRMPRSRR